MTTNIWNKRGTTFWPDSTADAHKMMPPGIYEYAVTPNGQWYLALSSNRYTFPYKIYGAHDHIKNRIQRAWQGLPGNFGVLLNGLKGTGKTITAQQVVNWAIDEGFVVLNVQTPVPLATIMAKVEQPMVVLFDEFEKTHDEDAQQELLSAIDGLSKNEFRRLFLFTTNTKKVNENFLDRPSRIRYNWEFGRLSADVINELLDDLLDPQLADLRQEILTYLNTRAVLTIDVAKTVIIECNIFREGPGNFRQIMNLTEKSPEAFRLEIVKDDGSTQEIASYFRTNSSAWLCGLLSKTGQKMFLQDYVAKVHTQTIFGSSGQAIQILGPTDVENEWICHVQIPRFDLGISTKLTHVEYLWLDEKPEGWKTPEWMRKVEAGKELTDEEAEEYEDWKGSRQVYSTVGKLKKVRLRISLNDAPFKYNYRDFMDA